ncbi:hypothetical protein VRZ08_19280 [Rhodopseudomonas sp. G2_2311]|uniref:hypothetical protein n=1 Tax=Rhodopseudomonas sp. G2_2311 TaxID=3114287 RepID=UPI0039C5E816
MKLCNKPIVGRSRFEKFINRRCYCLAGHKGKCDEYPYLKHLDTVAPRVRAKIQRDSTKTTGASWKSVDAGPNRIDRWGMLLPDAILKEEFDIDLPAMKQGVQAKLREKAATYDDCMEVAGKLTWAAYQMTNAPIAPPELAEYLTGRFGEMELGSNRCIVCRDKLDFRCFEEAQRGRALIETAHSNPRLHNVENVGFAHRECNIAQGGKSLEQFYGWIRSIVARVDAGVDANVDAPGSQSSTSRPNS